MTEPDRGEIQSRLAPGERIEWIGRPDPGKHLTRADLFLVPFSLMWGGFAIVWEIGVISSGAPIFFELWGIPFVLIGLYLIFGRFYYQAYRNRRTTYAVSTRRVMSVVAGARGETVEAMYLRAIPGITVTAGRSGRGSVQFGTPAGGFAGRFAGSGWPMSMSNRADSGIGFQGIDDPQAVANLVERLRGLDRD